MCALMERHANGTFRRISTPVKRVHRHAQGLYGQSRPGESYVFARYRRSTPPSR